MYSNEKLAELNMKVLYAIIDYGEAAVENEKTGDVVSLMKATSAAAQAFTTYVEEAEKLAFERGYDKAAAEAIAYAENWKTE